MNEPDAPPPVGETDQSPEPARALDTGLNSGPQAPPRASFWLRELPYFVVLILTLFGVAYMSFSKQSIVGYWEFLAPLIAIVCVANGWPHAPDRNTRLRLVWTQVLHWLAFVVAMNLILLSGVQTTFTANATGLMILTLLALGTFTAGVHILSWQICLLGVIMALGVPAIAWVERSALFLLLIIVAIAAVGAAFWWNQSNKPATKN